MLEIARILNVLETTRGRPAALATLVSVAGSSYRRPGARLLFVDEATRVGSISGGCLEEDILERARRVLATNRAELAVYDTTSENDLVWGVGLGCQGVVQVLIEPIAAERPAWVETLRTNQCEGRDTALAVAYGEAAGRGTRLLGTRGEAEVFYEVVSPPVRLIICGAGDDAQPLVALAKQVGWWVAVADLRPAYATPERFPGADRVVSGSVAEIAATLAPGAASQVVVMTHRYVDDRAFLREWLGRPLAYLGQLGPRKRTERLLAELQADGLRPVPETLANLHAPVGLDLGGATPETVALAIVAEIEARLNGRAAGFLRDRAGPIH